MVRPYTLRLIAAGMSREAFRARKRHYVRTMMERPHYNEDRRARHRHRRRMLRQLHRSLLRSYP